MCGHFPFRSINITESFGLKYLPKQWGVPPTWEVRYLSGFLGHFTHLHAHTHMQKNPKTYTHIFPHLWRCPLPISHLNLKFLLCNEKVQVRCVQSKRAEMGGGEHGFLSQVTPVWEKTQQCPRLASFPDSKGLNPADCFTSSCLTSRCQVQGLSVPADILHSALLPEPSHTGYWW